ncbi:MAG: 2-oxoacid:acceptor oxidoreductase family protein, partial [Deltaproteobacteria bacterium]|nr:2-oxoacid:acceptor oxidoreductase family protein [Deltaproteobacteria bacterium]
TVSQIDRAHIAVVLDESLLTMVNILGRLKDDGIIIINTHLSPEEIDIDGNFEVATVDASGIAREQYLIVAGAPVVNTPMLGALARATGLVSLENIEKGLRIKMSGGMATANFSAVRAAFEKTIVKATKER